MHRRFLAILLALVMLLGGCARLEPERVQYNATFLELFDTVTTVVGFAENEAVFKEQAQQIRQQLEAYHQLFDIYETYDGLNNLKTINDNAGVAPVEVDDAIIRLLLDCRAYYDLTGGRVNTAMGSVLQLWHEAREAASANPAAAALPDAEALAEAAKHCSWETVVIDEAAGTVFLSDPLQSLDVGGIAKGWAAQRVAEAAPEGMLIGIGGNICATGPKTEAGTPWSVGITDPAGSGTYLHTLNVTRGSVVTSGDYQRYYVVDGMRYHHIIDPQTLHPSRNWTSVTVICPDSGLADVLSTALFVCSLAEGLELLARCEAEAMWVDTEGNFHYSPGFPSYIRN